MEVAPLIANALLTFSRDTLPEWLYGRQFLMNLAVALMVGKVVGKMAKHGPVIVTCSLYEEQNEDSSEGVD